MCSLYRHITMSIAFYRKSPAPNYTSAGVRQQHHAPSWIGSVYTGCVVAHLNLSVYNNLIEFQNCLNFRSCRSNNIEPIESPRARQPPSSSDCPVQQLALAVKNRRWPVCRSCELNIPAHHHRIGNKTASAAPTSFKSSSTSWRDEVPRIDVVWSIEALEERTTLWV